MSTSALYTQVYTHACTLIHPCVYRHANTPTHTQPTHTHIQVKRREEEQWKGLPKHQGRRKLTEK